MPADGYLLRLRRKIIVTSPVAAGSWKPQLTAGAQDLLAAILAAPHSGGIDNWQVSGKNLATILEDETRVPEIDRFGALSELTQTG